MLTHHRTDGGALGIHDPRRAVIAQDAARAQELVARHVLGEVGDDLQRAFEYGAKMIPRYSMDNSDFFGYRWVDAIAGECEMHFP